MVFQPGLAYYPPELRFLLHIATWLVTVAVALFLPFVGYAAMKQLGFQLWPLFVGWARLALFIVYAPIASMGILPWLPVNWLLALGRAPRRERVSPYVERSGVAGSINNTQR